MTFGGLIQELEDSGAIYFDQALEMTLSKYDFITFDKYDIPRYKEV